MKTINVTFTDEEHRKLVRTKGDVSWHDFILNLLDPVALVSTKMRSHFQELEDGPK